MAEPVLLVSSRDALAKALGNLGGKRETETFGQYDRRRADALIASGAVVDAATLADDEALVSRVAAGTLGPAARMDDYDDEGQALLARRAERTLHALAAALSEREAQR